MRYPIKDKFWGWRMDPFEVFAHWDSWRTSPNLTLTLTCECSSDGHYYYYNDGVFFCARGAGGMPSKGVRRSMCMRIYYRRRESTAGHGSTGEQVSDGYFHTFCSTGTRLFNNIVITLRGEDEARGKFSSL